MDRFNIFYQTIEILDQVLLYLFIAAFAIQVFYYLYFYLSVFFIKKKSVEVNPTFGVSVIIAAHNEAENLKNFLPLVLNQDYPDFEVIVIDDRSEDDTETVLSLFKAQYPNLKTSFIKNNGKLKHGKKLAITLGVKAASFDHLLLTDADCKPSSDQWIKTMVFNFEHKPIVLGYGPYFDRPGFLNKLIRYETLFIAMQYFGFAKRNVPYMGIGRNLAYKKELFVNNKGLASHAHINSGDDDLFINEVATKDNVALEISPESFVYSNPNTKLKYWFRQKQRHFGTFSSYKAKHQLLLSLEIFSRSLFYVLALVLAVNQYYNYFFWILIAFRMLLQFAIMLFMSRKFKEKGLVVYLILFDFLLPVLNFFIYLRLQKTKRKKW